MDISSYQDRLNQVLDRMGQAAVRSGRVLSLDELKMAFKGWTYTDPRSPEEYTQFDEEHIRQQP